MWCNHFSCEASWARAEGHCRIQSPSINSWEAPCCLAARTSRKDSPRQGKRARQRAEEKEAPQGTEPSALHMYTLQALQGTDGTVGVEWTLCMDLIIGSEILFL